MKALYRVLPVLAIGSFAFAAEAQDTSSVPLDTGYVEYHESPISLPLGVGVRPPSYDRVNGLTLPWGPKLEMGDGRVEIDALVSYRSHLGNWDPSIAGTLRPGDENELTFFAGQGTFSNDEWIRSDMINSLVAFFAGRDARNYFRATRGTARFTRTFSNGWGTLSPFIGGNVEQDWSTGSIPVVKRPWSVFGHNGFLQMRRFNPHVAKGSISSVLGGTGLEFVRGGVEGKLDATVERSLQTHLAADCGSLGPALCFPPGDSFTQGSIDGRLFFPTFGSQTFTLRTHAVLTTGPGITPAQRFAYLGGSGTLATVNLLALGGDRLFFIDGDYMIPIEKIQLPIVGSPFVALHYSAGNAGIERLPSLIQNIGAGVGVSMLRVDFMLDPATNRSVFSQRFAVSFGINLSL
jgi:hypothetical protein